MFSFLFHVSKTQNKLRCVTETKNVAISARTEIPRVLFLLRVFILNRGGAKSPYYPIIGLLLHLYLVQDNSGPRREFRNCNNFLKPFNQHSAKLITITPNFPVSGVDFPGCSVISYNVMQYALLPSTSEICLSR